MSAVGSLSEARVAIPAEPRQPRAQGMGRIGVDAIAGKTCLSTFHQQGSARILLPTTPDPGLEAVLLNTAGGMTGGDRFDWAADAAAGARLTLTTQAAERAYRARPGEIAGVATRLRLGPGARIDWLPQETILFDGCAVNRHLDVDMDRDAMLLAVEPLLFGRAAMGERLDRALFTDHWRIRRDGKLLHAEALRLVGPVSDILERPAVLNGANAMATIVFVAPDAEARLDPVRALLSDAPEAGASCWDGRMTVRIAARGGAALRGALIPVLMLLRGGPLPRVWTM